MSRAVVVAMALVAALAIAPAARAQAVPGVPAIRAGGPTLVVCRPDSAARVRRIWAGRGPRTTRSRRARLRLLGRCAHRDLRTAVAAARSGTRILVLPGVYRETVTIAGRDDVQLQGTGRFARDTIVAGDRRAADVIRAERADGVAIVNLTVEQGAASAIDVVATDGFRLQKLVARWSQHDGVRMRRSGHGLVDRVEAYGNGDAGFATGAQWSCGRPAVELRDVWAYGNVLGASGSAYAHDSRFVSNSAGVAADSFAPGRPQGCSRWERNVIAGNNRDFFTGGNQASCAATPFAQRRTDEVCPQRAVPVGSGLILYGANRNTVSANAIYGNRRSGVRLFWTPASARGQADPALQFDTSRGNRFVGNRFGAPQRNGIDVVWDGEGQGNCWSGPVATSDPPALPACPGGNPLSTGDPAKQALEVPCAAWDPRTDPDPAGCDWFDLPQEPR